MQLRLGLGGNSLGLKDHKDGEVDVGKTRFLDVMV